MKKITLLIIDDEENLCKSISFALRNENIEFHGALSGVEGLRMMPEVSPDAVLLDLRLPDQSGLVVLQELIASYPDLPIIMISAHGDTKAAVQAIRLGAVDYLTKPFDVDELLVLVKSCLERRKLKAEVAYHRQNSTKVSRIVGDSPPLHKLQEQLQRVSKSSARSILLCGETGTGKGLVARTLHNMWCEQNAPFIQVNCAALPENLIEAELFGAEKGAYTGAVNRRIGLVEMADGGTLFLDEIGELPLLIQSKFLTFLEGQTYRPVGSPRELTSNARVISATNRDLAVSQREGRFRRDLFFRLSMMPITIPPLRKRLEDIKTLTLYFSEIFAASEGCRAISFSEQALELFSEYPWPGNVRELKNLVERLTILYPGKEITISHLPNEFGASYEFDNSTIEERLSSKEREVIQKALSDSGGKKGLAAETLGISRHALKRRMQRLGMS